MSYDIDLRAYDFQLPPEQIAQEPASPRDSARLFVYDTTLDVVAFDTFKNIGRYLPKKTMLVLNDTKVIPARLHLTKETGGKIEVLLLTNEWKQGDRTIKGFVDRNIAVGAKLAFASGAHLTVTAQDEQHFLFTPSVPFPKLLALIQKEGTTPIPPYIKHSPLDEKSLRTKYQSVFAKDGASVAAPTASLHFTNNLRKKLAADGVKETFVTLHVGTGTFLPIGDAELHAQRLHQETCAIDKTSANAINHALMEGYNIIPVGTTAMRTLETFATPYHNHWNVHSGSEETRLFIAPPYEFHIANGLITNFHTPKSSLMLLVDALLAHKKAKRRIMELYTIAQIEGFRFYSFGDSMLIT